MFSCNTCNKTFSTKHSLSSHRYKYHNGLPSQAGSTVDKDSESGFSEPEYNNNDVDHLGSGSDETHGTTTPNNEGASTEDSQTASDGSNESLSDGKNSRAKSPDRDSRKRRHSFSKPKAKKTKRERDQSSTLTPRLREADHDVVKLLSSIKDTLHDHTSKDSRPYDMLLSFQLKHQVFETLIPTVFSSEDKMRNILTDDQFSVTEAVFAIQSITELVKFFNENPNHVLAILDYVQTHMVENHQAVNLSSTKDKLDKNST